MIKYGVLQHCILYGRKPLGPPVGATVGIFVLSTPLQNDLIVSIPLDAPHQPLVGFQAFSKLALLGRNSDLGCLIGKVAMEAAPFLTVVLIIPDPEELPATKHAKIEHKIVGRATIDVRILDLDRENILGLSRA